MNVAAFQRAFFFKERESEKKKIRRNTFCVFQSMIEIKPHNKQSSDIRGFSFADRNSTSEKIRSIED